ncbi:MAG: amino acid ABC transporter permease, partial [Desulfovibrio sp.]
NSSLVAVIGVAEIFYQARQVESNTALAFQAFTVSTLIYLIISLLVSLFINWYNNKYLRMIKY